MLLSNSGGDGRSNYWHSGGPEVMLCCSPTPAVTAGQTTGLPRGLGGGGGGGGVRLCCSPTAAVTAGQTTGLPRGWGGGGGRWSKALLLSDSGGDGRANYWHSGGPEVMLCCSPTPAVTAGQTTGIPGGLK